MKLLLAAILTGSMIPVCFGGETDEASRSDTFLAAGSTHASHRGVYQVVLECRGHADNPYFDVDLTVTFTRPDHSRVAVEGFFDGGRSFKARAYCLRGVQGYYDAKAAGKLVGGDDFVHIHTFFRESETKLVEMVPDPALVGSDPSRANCIHDETRYIVYIANPSGSRPETDDASVAATTVTLKLPVRNFRVKWFQPTSGRWTEAPPVAGGQQTLRTPGPGDWVLLCTR